MSRKKELIMVICGILFIAFLLSLIVTRDSNAQEEKPAPPKMLLTEKQSIELKMVYLKEKLDRLKAEYELTLRDLRVLEGERRKLSLKSTGDPKAGPEIGD